MANQDSLNKTEGERFFLVMGLVLLALVFAGFLPPAFERPGGVASIPPLLHVHAAVFVAWFIVFCLQARLAGSGNIALHMRLGKISVLLAAAMIGFAFVVIRGAYANPEWSIGDMSRAASVMFPFTDIVNFTIAYGLALAHRRNAAAHKRLMLLAGILMIDPAVARLVTTLAAPMPLALVPELLLFGALIVYDLLTRKRPSWTTLLGLGLFTLALAAKFTVAQLPQWESFVELLFA